MKSKPYKKSYRKGERIYRLISYCDNYGNLTVKIVLNTIKSIHKTRPYDEYQNRPIELKFDNYGHRTCVDFAEVATRTLKGKEFLKKAAIKILNKKIKELSAKQNYYNRLMSNFQ